MTTSLYIDQASCKSALDDTAASTATSMRSATDIALPSLNIGVPGPKTGGPSSTTFAAPRSPLRPPEGAATSSVPEALLASPSLHFLGPPTPSRRSPSRRCSSREGGVAAAEAEGMRTAPSCTTMFFISLRTLDVPFDAS